ncbi:molybdenum cofactor guanylyltransferase [Xanthomonas translucens]|uniref:Molybdenum cofactor guanylyltransferase n=1 Tax=Xanthomonas translucens pv. translucens DSM 18974 TaxID=1261556 RepID=A0A1C3TNS2_XANCT|nr:NTP transferase domain-containing protein [Xanthomonas translucens]MCC8446854.1 NTP transferase domain-containing protein [Xanthomonas translucens pv. translucens]MCT8285445.1 NTP transferase domain-containing protein [Xanthomonas translucens pv. translucens]MCT8303103.1 NTP transferase domain-containing protein [Xanthomonas translucens pv. translucens]QSQ29151.1 NTP transferase domain-containing protein [Xanthomonas translucens pv. translucens]UNU00071.1 NTP transferase domain-containing p
MDARREVTLGILAGGRAQRLGGCDKAWLQRDGQPLVRQLVQALAPSVAAVLVSANRDLPRYAAVGLHAVPDRIVAPAGAERSLGPIAGLDALAAACTTPWLLTLPVDLRRLPSALPTLLIDAVGAGDGAYVEDDDGLQPLAALYRVARLRPALAAALAARDYAPRALQRALTLACVRLPGVLLGNLNTPQDLHAAGILPAP